MEYTNHSIGNVDVVTWNQVLKECPYSTVFHTLEWIKALVKGAHLNEFLLIGWEDSKPICIFPYFTSKNLIFRVHGSPLPETGAMYGGPLFTGSADLDEALKIFEGKGGIFESSFLKLPPGYPIAIFEKRHYEVEEVPTYILDLDIELDELWKNVISKKARNSVRKAQKSDVKIKINGSQSLDRYYEMHLETCSRNSLNPFDKNLLDSIVQMLEKEGMLKIFIAEKGGEPISGSIFLFHKKNILYWMGDSLSDYMKYSPNDLIQWSIMEFGIENGYTTYDLGGGGIPGITSFKKKWNGKEVSFYRAFKGSYITRGIKKAYKIGRQNPIISKLFRSGL